MLARFLMIFSAVFVLAACSSTKSDDGGMGVGNLNGLNNEAAVEGGNGLYAQDEGPAPGTQADLVVNVGDRVFFDTDSSEINASARVTLENQAAWLGQYQSLSVVVEGHADERGTREYNLALGERRAVAVKNYLVALGVPPSRITTISYGKERPAVPGADESAWAQNRRGVTKVQ